MRDDLVVPGEHEENFVLIKQINRLTPPPAPAPEPRLCPFCKTAIADDATRCPHCTSQL